MKTTGVIIHFILHEINLLLLVVTLVPYPVKIVVSIPFLSRTVTLTIHHTKRAKNSKYQAQKERYSKMFFHLERLLSKKLVIKQGNEEPCLFGGIDWACSDLPWKVPP